MKKTIHYEKPLIAEIPMAYSQVLCESIDGSKVNDLTEDDTTLGGLFD